MLATLVSALKIETLIVQKLCWISRPGAEVGELACCFQVSLALLAATAQDNLQLAAQNSQMTGC